MPRGLTPKRLSDADLKAEVLKAKAEGHNKTWLKFDLQGRNLGIHDKRLKEAWDSCITS